MNKKLNKLKQKGFNNIISFFVEFFLLSSVFSSTMNTSNLYSFIVKILPFVTKEILLSGSLALIILSTSIRTVYARYLNIKMDILEKELVNSNELKKNVLEKENKIENRNSYQKNINYHYIDTIKNKKKLVKVYKK